MASTIPPRVAYAENPASSRGRKVAEAPVKGLRLPIGRQELRLVNPPSGRRKTIMVTVPGKPTSRVDLAK